MLYRVNSATAQSDESTEPTARAAQRRHLEALLAEAGEYARGFNAQHTRLMAELGDLVHAATARARLPPC